jgi:Uma2 family endonuclease
MSTTTPPAAAPTRLLTAEEYFLVPDNGKPTELVKGVIVEMSLPMPRHGQICARSSYLLQRHQEDNPSGHVVTNDSAIITERGPDTVRGADIAFYSFAKIPAGEMPIGYVDIPPDLAFEVRSPSDRWPRIIRKVSEYLESGVTLVCVFDDATRTAHLSHAERGTIIIASDGELDLSEVLPGFRVPVRKFFE